MKNLIGHSLVEKMGREISLCYPEFPTSKFIKLSSGLNDLELKARVLLITSHLRKYLPEDYKKTLPILVDVMKRDQLRGFDLWPFSEYIGQFGLGHFDHSLKAMAILTQKFTAEFAVRPFFLENSSKVLNFFEKKVTHKNSHIRRWVSEGSRPLLPWAERLPEFILDPSHTLPLLEILKYDHELYVRKSVANHLNDISKHHPLIVTQTMKKWVSECPAEHQEKIQWIKRQGLRTLIKKGNKEALKLMGVVGKAKVNVGKITLIQKNFKLGDALQFQLELSSNSKFSQKLVIDYVIDFVKANGKTGSKVYKLKVLDMPSKEVVLIKKSHSLKPITTMTYYSGLHRLRLQINGEIVASVDWILKAAPTIRSKS